MIAVIASVLDDEAAALAGRWARYEAVLLTPPDLSQPGWRLEVGQRGGAFVAQGARRRAADLTGVLVRLPTVPPWEMVGVVPEDREYAASESTAMLSWWLGGLSCPVVNRPTPTCLTGPNRSRHEWLARAARLGLRTLPDSVHGSAERFHGSAPSDGSEPAGDRAPSLVAVAEGHAVSGPPAARRAAELLAAEAEARLLGAWFQDQGGGQWALESVTAVPPLSEETIKTLEQTLA